MPRAPHESNLEKLCLALGAEFISKHVQSKFQVESPNEHTATTAMLRSALEERIPLLVSPSIASRLLVMTAASMLGLDNLEIHQATSIVEFHSLGAGIKTIHRQATTCCFKKMSNQRRALHVTESFDWFEVGRAIGEMILRKCHVQDAFFIGSLLETPPDRLQTRGFAVGRILVLKDDSAPGDVKLEQELEEKEESGGEKEEEDPVLLPSSVADFVTSAASTAQAAASKFPGSSWLGSSVDVLKNMGGRTIACDFLSEPLLEKGTGDDAKKKASGQNEESSPPSSVHDFVSTWW